MYTPQDISKLLFLDIETVRGTDTYEELSEQMQKMWHLKAKRIEPESTKTDAEKYLDNAGIYAEFGKIVCISFGTCRYDEKEKRISRFFVKSVYGADERELLKQFATILDTKAKDKTLCAHNGKEFDFPYMCRRFLILQMPIPKILETQGKKPWEISHVDTMEMWRFGDYKAYTKLELLCAIFQIPTPKDDIDGSQVGKVFWEEKDAERIATYCEKDVLATAQVFLKYSIQPLLKEEEIDFLEKIACN